MHHWLVLWATRDYLYCRNQQIPPSKRAGLCVYLLITLKKGLLLECCLADTPSCISEAPLCIKDSLPSGSLDISTPCTMHPAESVELMVLWAYSWQGSLQGKQSYKIYADYPPFVNVFHQHDQGWHKKYLKPQLRPRTPHTWLKGKHLSLQLMVVT